MKPNAPLNGKIRTFPLRVVLTLTTGKLLTKSRGDRDNGISDLYELLEHMAGEAPFTHQLGRFGDECKPWLYRWYPELVSVEGRLDKLADWIAKSQDGPETGIVYWLAEIKMLFPELKDEYEIGQIPRDDHEAKDSYDELVAALGTDENIIVVDTGSEVTDGD